MLTIRKSDLDAEAGQVGVVTASSGVHRGGDTAPRQTVEYSRDLIGCLCCRIGACRNGQAVTGGRLVAQRGAGTIFGGGGHHALNDKYEAKIEHTPEQQKKEDENKREINDRGTPFAVLTFDGSARADRSCGAGLRPCRMP